MLKKDKELYEFGQFRLNVTEHLLERVSGGERVPLSAKAFETLCILVRNSGHLVHKDELMNQVWADSFVEENNLDKCIYAIRRALGEKSGEQQFIETVRKHGYRFVAEVLRIQAEEISDALHQEDESLSNGNSSAESPLSLEQSITQRSRAVVAMKDWRHEADGVELIEHDSPAIKLEESNEQTNAQTVPANQNSQKGKHLSKYRLPLVAFALAALIIGIGTLSYYFYARKNASSADGKKTIAVLPLKPINTANRDEIYEIGIAESLIYRLSSMKGFIVRPLSAIRKYADINQDALAAGREQQVDYILASNYQMADGKLRITSQLFNVANGQIEETYKSEKAAGDVFAMQDAIAGEVGNILLARFATTSSSPKAVRGTTNEESYRLYLQGMYLYDKRSVADARKAVEVLDQAVRLDPNYALAWAGLAHTHRYAGNLGRDTDTHEEYRKSIEAINRALALDANLSEAHSALCENKYFYEYDFAGADRECRRAVELDPNSSIAHEIYSRYLSGRGRHDEAISEIKTAISLEPTSFFNQLVYGDTFYQARRFDEAAAQYKRLIETEKNPSSAYNWLFTTLALQGKEAEAFEWFIKSRILQKEKEDTLQVFQTAYQTSGWQGVLRERVKRFDKGNEFYYFGAGFAAQVGDKDKAFEYLEKSYQRREWGLAYLQVEPRLDNLRGDPRFDELIRRVESK
jgi:DNA-binding winged helix-turn-helix (wHTH) protein/TolB-like protein/Tfp pilus assembly protein PilF